MRTVTKIPADTAPPRTGDVVAVPYVGASDEQRSEEHRCTTTTRCCLMSRARAAGLAIGAVDVYIAATAAANRMAVATRDAAAFEAAGIPVIDPWRQQQK
jgi:hypothetical protein